MNGKERIRKILKHQPVDRIGVYEHFWTDTYKAYRERDNLPKEACFEDHFGLDMQECWPFNLVADLDFEKKKIAETENTVTYLDGNGAYLKQHKFHDTTPEHVGFTVTCKADWEKYKHFFKEIDERRIDFEKYRRVKAKADAAGRFFTCSSVNVFEAIHPICGHENMLIGMALEPDWILDMAETYSSLLIKLQKTLFEREGYPDAIWFYDDMGFKEKPFMSPKMYCDLIQPFHKKTIDFAHSLNLPVIMHSCGFVYPLLPHMVDAGIDCLQAIEVKAGMDLIKIYEEFGDKIALMGGIDVRCMYSNDETVIDRELEAKIPIVKDGYGFILHSDHSIPENVDYKTLKYFIKKGIELGAY